MRCIDCKKELSGCKVAGCEGHEYEVFSYRKEHEINRKCLKEIVRLQSELIALKKQIAKTHQKEQGE